ncbi:hypothetical protein ACFLTI_07890 [Bacteroidota bacterium]
MKKNILVLVGTLMIFSIVSGQNRGSNRKDFHEKMKENKIKFFTERLGFTVEESKAFWPLFDEYEKKKNEIRKLNDMRSLYRRRDSISNEELERVSDKYVLSKVKEADLLKKYHEKFKEILPVRKVIKLYHVEDQYKSYLLEQIRGQRNGSRGGNRSEKRPESQNMHY